MGGHAAADDPDESGGLLRRALDGDASACDELFGRHRAALHRVVARRLGPSLRGRLDPSDVVQEAHVEALERLEEFAGRRPMPFRSWLIRTALQRVAKLRRHATAARRDLGRERPLAMPGAADGSSSPGWDARSIAVPADGPTPSQQAATRDAAARLHAVLHRLPEPDRAILAMRTFEGLSYDEAAARLEIEPAAARKRYGRALLRLRASLIAEGLTESTLWTIA
jgi:RNA polymerase sigma-70 factor, ECF subfamily